MGISPTTSKRPLASTGGRPLRRRGRIGTVAALLGIGLYALAVPAVAAESPFQNAERHLQSPVLDVAGGGTALGGGAVSKATCRSTGDPAANVDLSCDSPFSPDNEVPIVADPANPDHLLAGSNDYQLTLTGSVIQARVPTGFFTSFDGGRTWVDGQIPMGNGASGGNGDPSPAFDARFHTAHMAQLSAAQGQFGPFAGHINVSVSTSRDGGLTWGQPVTVDIGHASTTPSANAVFLDKEWLWADNTPTSPHYGRLYVSYDRIAISKGAFLDSPVMLSYSDDAGSTWSTPRAISGSNPVFCTANQGSRAIFGSCDESFFSYGTALPNGDVVVTFINQQHAAAWEVPNEFEDQAMAVRSSDGGQTWSNPVHIADLEDGGAEGVVFSDYPANVDGRATQTGFQFRTGSWQGLAQSDPVTGAVYVTWTDNRDGLHDVAHPVTSTNVFLSRSTDGGRSWSATIRVSSGAPDKFFPAVAARAGVVKVMYMDTTYDPSHREYGITLATSTDGGSTWSRQRVDTGLSMPNNSMWFRANTPGCELCATFIGDYNGVAIDTLGRTHIVWTDMRRVTTAFGRTGAPQDAFYARR